LITDHAGFDLEALLPSKFSGAREVYEEWLALETNVENGQVPTPGVTKNYCRIAVGDLGSKNFKEQFAIVSWYSKCCKFCLLVGRE